MPRDDTSYLLDMLLAARDAVRFSTALIEPHVPPEEP